MRRIVHLDMDAFYASVEQRDNPALAGLPLIVGGRSERRGVVCAASYEARRYGIRSAMPTARAFRLCPEVVRVDPRFLRYREVSQQIHEIFARYTPWIEPLSLDESFLDLTEYCADHQCKAGAVAREIKAEIRAVTGLTASAGVAPNKLVAKIASDLRKPDGFVVVPPDEVEGFMRPLPVDRLWGVGPVTARRLQQLGLQTAGDVADRSAAWLEAHLGAWGRELGQQARGQDDRPVVSEHEPRSVSAENTFARDVKDQAVVLRELEALADEVVERLGRHHVVAHTVVLKLRYADFSTITRRSTHSDRIVTAPAILAAARELLTRTEFPGRSIRLIGVGVTTLIDETAPHQLPLWE